ncbi:aldo/keto reductase [Arthrobacter sp. MDT2-16]
MLRELLIGTTMRAPSALTIGASNFGRGTSPQSDGEAKAISLAEASLTAGHAYLDTSNNYADGRSEAVIGQAIQRLGDRLSTEVITKVDPDPISGRFDRDRVLASFEESLSRLGVDRLPLLHLHDPDMLTMAQALGRRGVVEGLVELRSSGAVDAIGVAGGSVPMMSAYLATGEFDAVLCHNRYTLIDQSAEVLFTEARQRNMTIFNAAPFGAGILSTGAQPNARYAYQSADEKLTSWVQQVEILCAELQVTLPAVALAFSLKSPLIDSTVVGASSVERIADLTRLSQEVIPDQFWDQLTALGPAPSPVLDPPL